MVTSKSPDDYGGRTLLTLPAQIKNQIFSRFLLGENVKYSINGTYPGHKYKFDKAIMRVNKGLHEDATTYIRDHNEFVLIHVKFFAFEIDKGRFLPVVATGTAAKSFKHSTVEATIQRLGSSINPSNPVTPKREEKVTRALLLSQDLDLFIGQLKLAYHLWPTHPIYIHSAPDICPIEWSTSPVQTRIQFVWKINQPFRQDLPEEERHERQTRLLAPITKLINAGQKVTILGAEQDLAAQTIRSMTARLLSLDAVGWDLYDLMQAQKQYLDQIPNTMTMEKKDLSDAYTIIPMLGWFYLDGLSSDATAFIFKQDYHNDENPDRHPLAYWALENGQYSLKELEESGFHHSSWQFGILVTCLDCLLTMTKMALDLRMHNTGNFYIGFCKKILETPYFVFADEIQSAVWHYEYFFQLWIAGPEKRTSAYSAVLVALDDLLDTGAANDFDDEYIRQDRDRVARITSREIKVCHQMEHNFPGLMRRPRIRNTQLNLDRPESLSLEAHVPSKIAALITRMADNPDEIMTMSDETVADGHICLGVFSPIHNG